MANPVDMLTPEQQALYDDLTGEQQQDIVNKITTINSLNDVQANNELRNSVRQYFGNNPHNINLLDGAIDGAINQAKTEIVTEYNADIDILLDGNPDPALLRRVVGTGLNGVLINKAVDILSRPVGGKFRKTSNKKKRPTARRRRSSKARKARKSRSTRRS